jgi:hypothetical protein
LRDSSGNLATFAAIRHASLLVSGLAADRRSAHRLIEVPAAVTKALSIRGMVRRPTIAMGGFVSAVSRNGRLFIVR